MTLMVGELIFVILMNKTMQQHRETQVMEVIHSLLRVEHKVQLFLLVVSFGGQLNSKLDDRR
jgi:hypothetical protein